LVDDDPEALVDRRLLGNREDAAELVLQRTGLVEVDVGRRERQPLAAARQERLQRGLLAGGGALAAALALALGLEQVGVEAGAGERLALLGRDRLAEQLVDCRHGLGRRLAL